MSASGSDNRTSTRQRGSDGGMVLAHFIVSADVERSRRFYTDVLGGKKVVHGEHDDEVT